MQFSNGQIGVRTAESWGTIPDARKEIINPEVPRSTVCRETQTDVNEAAFADRWKQKVLKTGERHCISAVVHGCWGRI